MIDVTDETQGMECPCLCKCGKWFDLDDGHTSIEDDKTLICEACAQKEDDEEERRLEIEEIKDSLSDAIFDTHNYRNRLRELGEDADEFFRIQDEALKKRLEKEQSPPPAEPHDI